MAKTTVGISAEKDTRASARKYLKDNRNAWRALGIRPITANVPDPIRDVVLAEMEVHKFMHLAELAEDEASDVNVLDEIARRNMIKYPSEEQIEEIEGMLENNERAETASVFLDNFKLFRKKYNGVRSHYDPDMEYGKRKRIEAKGVSYTNLACAYFRLAAVVLDSAGPISVFGHHATPPVGD